MLQVLAAFASIAGITLAYLLFLRRGERIAQQQPAMPAQEIYRIPWLPRRVEQFWYEGWGFDRLYAMLFVRPFVWLATVNRADVIDRAYRGLAATATASHGLLRATQTGRLRWYAASIALGAAVAVALVVWS